MDIEDRNAMARSAARNADLVVVVGTPGVKGLHSLLRVIREVIAAGVPGSQVLPVINRAPRDPRARAEIAATLGELLALGGETSVPSPLHLSERHRVEDALRDRSEEHTSELQSLMRISYAVFCLKKKKNNH